MRDGWFCGLRAVSGTAKKNLSAAPLALAAGALLLLTTTHATGRVQDANASRPAARTAVPAGRQVNSTRPSPVAKAGGAAQQPAPRSPAAGGAQTPRPKPSGGAGGPQRDQRQEGPAGGQPGGMTSAAVPRVGADLSATRTTANEFAQYLKQLPTSGRLYFRLRTLAPSAQKVVWQIGSQPFGQPRHSADWKAPAGLLKSGEATFSKPGAAFQIDFAAALGPPTQKARRVYVRALVLADGRLAAHPSNDVVVDYSAAANVDVVVPEGSGHKPGVRASVTILTYKPPVRKSDPCRLVLTKTPPAGELKVILSKIKATTPGMRFSLCSSDYAYLKQNLSPGEWAAVAFQDFLKTIKSGYNWLDDKYNFVENRLVEALDSVGVPPNVGRKVINYYKAVYGLSPSYGNFDEALDHGKAAFAAYLADSGEVSEQEKKNIAAKFGQFVNEVKSYANGGQDPNQFYRMDPDYAARPAYVVLRVRYEAANGAPADAVGGKTKLAVRVVSGRTVDKSTLNGSFASGHQEWPPITLAEKTVELPDARVGTVIDIPVYVDYSSYYKSDEYRWTQGYNSTEPGTIQAGGASVKWVVNKRYQQ